MEDSGDSLSSVQKLSTDENAMSVFSPLTNLSSSKKSDQSENPLSFTKMVLLNEAIAKKNNPYDPSFAKSMELFSPLDQESAFSLEKQPSTPSEKHAHSISQKLNFSPYEIETKKRMTSENEADSKLKRLGLHDPPHPSSSTSSTSSHAYSFLASTKPSRIFPSSVQSNKTVNGSFEFDCLQYSNAGSKSNGWRSAVVWDDVEAAEPSDLDKVQLETFAVFSQSPEIKSSQKSQSSRQLRASRDFPVVKSTRKTEKTSASESGSGLGLGSGLSSDSNASTSALGLASASGFGLYTASGNSPGFDSGSGPGLRSRLGSFGRIKSENAKALGMDSDYKRFTPRLENNEDVNNHLINNNNLNINSNDRENINNNENGKLKEEISEMNECIRGDVKDLHVDFLRFMHQNQVFQMQQTENLSQICDRIEKLEQKFVRLENEIKCIKNSY